MGRESNQEPEYKASLFTLLLVTLSYYYRRSGNLFHAKNFPGVNFFAVLFDPQIFIFFIDYFFNG